MAPIDWDMLMKLDAQELHNNAEVADDMYDVLCGVCITNCTVLWPHYILFPFGVAKWNFAWNTQGCQPWETQNGEINVKK